mmetsp:Transcript_102829/g.294832  ORF Transcript_102829/g.294832 Transcript_102829/m.294832 type:complete len:381 (-) Transcript_102829:173-1315(-)
MVLRIVGALGALVTAAVVLRPAACFLNTVPHQPVSRVVGRSTATATSRRAEAGEGESGAKPLRPIRKALASLSLKDAEWRKKVTEASSVGDLSEFGEKQETEGAKKLLNLASEVVDAETKRAEEIIASGGEAIRPMSAANPGPLGLLEKEAVNALQNLIVAEGRRAEVLFKDGKVIRPMESAHPEFLGLLGELEKNTVTQLEKIRDAEITRASKFGPLTRPKDVPFSERSALSTVEEEAQTLVKAEVERLKAMLETGDVLVRPMDGEGVLGKAERGVVGTAETLLAYEKARLAQLKEQGYYMRPMEKDPESLAGKAEAVGVTFGTGLLRAPVMVGATIKRVTELLVSELGDDKEFEDEKEMMAEALPSSVRAEMKKGEEA